ncbi:MAG: hypothetical protein LBS09_05195 [Bacteroidales bacterium]|jgi:hypothetical protein|nr:hypothetical protein [Bacteroidales bacterium]
MSVWDNRMTVKQKWLTGILSCLAACATAYLVSHARNGLLYGSIIIMIPFAFLVLVLTYRHPILILYALFLYGFFIRAFDRYMLHGRFPVGILCDGMILYAYALLFVKGAVEKGTWKRFGDAPLPILLIWLAYCIISRFTPESPGLNAWLSAARPHMYLVFTIPLFCILLNMKTLKSMLILWGACSVILTVKGFWQHYVGLDAEELNMMNDYMASTHLLWGKLRVFSLCSDAGQFGVQQGHALTAGAVLLLFAKTRKEQICYLFIALAGLYGMFDSGTRGAIFVPIGGLMLYCVLVKNTKLILTGLVLGIGFVCFMKYTTIGNGNYAIYRMRTAFNPDKDPSYIVRKQNQQILKDYLSSRPFGGGLGSMDSGSEHSLLKKIPYDSGYVLIWGDQGIVGVILYIAMYLYFLAVGTYKVWFVIKNKWLRGVLIAMIAGIGGDMIAHYGNPVMTQHPTLLVLVFSIATIFVAQHIDREMEERPPQPETAHAGKYRRFTKHAK